MSRNVSGFEMLSARVGGSFALFGKALAGSLGIWRSPAFRCLAVLALLTQGCTGGRGTPAPLLYEHAPAAIAGQYMVVFRESASAVRAASRSQQVRDPAAAAQSRAAQALVRTLGGEVRHVYTAALTGFSATLTPAALERLRAMPGVAWIEANQRVTVATVQDTPPPPLGLDRTSERLGIDQRYTYWQTGLGVTAYVIDTGVRVSHKDFRGPGGVGPSRASNGPSFVLDGNGTTDCNGHGTHVAGTIGGTRYGIAKEVTLVAVRVLDCGGGGSWDDVAAGIDWVAANAPAQSVVNISIQGPISMTADTAVQNLATAGGPAQTGITTVVAAGNFNTDACTISPAHNPDAITVGNANPLNDTRASDSNFGTCLDLYGPGVDILSAGHMGDDVETDTAIKSGTSMAAPHVAGVAAFVLQDDPTATPATVLSKIHYAANVTTDLSYAWGGIIDRGAGSPNELLHWGSGDPHDGYTDGDPHLTTVEGLHYDFQAAGEFTLLRDRGGMEIQVRQSPVSTTFRPGPDGYHGLTTCVSLNTAVAARVAGHRVTWQPNVSGVPDPGGLQLRIDGVLTALSPSPVNVGSATVRRSSSNGMEIRFPNGTILVATPGWWADQSAWYINLSVFNTRATEGIIGVRPAGSWLPALPDGSSLNGMPASLDDRYLVLYGRFGQAWRVTNRTSLFDYRPGTSTATFTARDWPTRTGQCIAPRMPSQPAVPVPPARPAEPRLAQEACRALEDRNARANCVFDVTATGDTGFARVYQVSERIRAQLSRDRRPGDGPTIADQPRPPRNR